MGGVVGGGIPEPFVRIDLVITHVLIGFVLHIAEHEKFSFGAEVRSVSDSALPQMGLGSFGNTAWVTTVWLAREGVIDVSE